MAWLLTNRVDSIRYGPRIEAIPPCPDHRTEREYLRANGFFPDGKTRAGKAIDVRFWPVSGRFVEPVKFIPRLLGLCGFDMVPEAWRDAIEELEPGVHQFKHIPLQYRDGSQLEERFYAFNIMQVLRQVVDRERSTARLKTFISGAEKYVKTSDHPTEKIVFKKSAVSGRHLWVSSELIQYTINVSDVLFQRLVSFGGIDTIKYLKIEEV